jgi:hypothetical protein
MSREAIEQLDVEAVHVWTPADWFPDSADAHAVPLDLLMSARRVFMIPRIPDADKLKEPAAF